MPSVTVKKWTGRWVANGYYLSPTATCREWQGGRVNTIYFQYGKVANIAGYKFGFIFLAVAYWQKRGRD